MKKCKAHSHHFTTVRRASSKLVKRGNMNKDKNLIFIITLLFSTSLKFSASIDCSVKMDNMESKIKNKIFCNGYDSSIRPVQDHKTTTTVDVSMMIKSYDYDDLGSTLTLNTWMINKWKDEYLVWDSREYNDIKTIDISSAYIWRPDISLFNADISYGIGSCHETNCLIQSSGNVTCVEPCSFTGHCQSDYTLWPFDRQNCTMIFGPWMNSKDEIDFVEDKITLTSDGAAEHTEWKLISSGVRKRVVQVSSKDKKFAAKYPNLSYFFVIERHSSMVFKIIGVALFTFISLNMISLLIRNRQNERMSLLMINVLLHFEMIHQMSWMIPHNGQETPKILLFFRNSLIITCSLLVEAMIVGSLYVCEAQPAERLRSFVNTMRTNQMMNLVLQYKPGGSGVVGTKVDKANDDGTVLVEELEGQNEEEEETQEEEVKSTPNKKEIWQFLAIAMDRILIIALIVIYVISIFTLIPIARLAISNPISVEK